MLKKKVAFLATAAAAALLIGSTGPVANAALKPDTKAVVGDECLRIGKKAIGRGAERMDLTCTRVTTGSYAGTLRWWYPDVKPLKNIDWTIPANPGGYSLTSTAISDSLKAEGLLGDYTSVYKPGAGGAVGLGAFQEIKGKPSAALITGIAMTGGLYSNKSKLNLLDSTPIAKILREYNAIVVPVGSRYRDLKSLMTDLAKSPSSIAIAGGNKGGVDHQIMGLLAEKGGIEATKLNYVVYSGGAEVVTSLLSGATQVGISGTGEFATYIAAGKLRVLGVSSAKSLKGFKGKTFRSQGYDLVYGNWRGVMAPGDISEADRVNFVKVMDILRTSPSWGDQLRKNNWDNEFAGGKDFKAFLEDHIPEINKVMKGLGI